MVCSRNCNEYLHVLRRLEIGPVSPTVPGGDYCCRSAVTFFCCQFLFLPYSHAATQCHILQHHLNSEVGRTLKDHVCWDTSCVLRQILADVSYFLNLQGLWLSGPENEGATTIRNFVICQYAQWNISASLLCRHEILQLWKQTSKAKHPSACQIIVKSRCFDLVRVARRVEER